MPKIVKKEVPVTKVSLPSLVVKETPKVIGITIEGDDIAVLKDILAIASAGNAPSRVKALVSKINQQL
jgi:hypothetical protein